MVVYVPIVSYATTFATPEAAVGAKPVVSKDTEVAKIGVSIAVEVSDVELDKEEALFEQ